MRSFLTTTSTLLVGALLGSCAIGPPSSSKPGLYSADTGLPIIGQGLTADSGTEPMRDGVQAIAIDGPPQRAYRGWPDYQVVKMERCRPNGPAVPLPTPAGSQAPSQSPLIFPGNVVLPGVSFRPDEAEVSNLAWQQFIRRLEWEGDAAAAARMWPAAAALPRPDYFLNPFYHFYPVVGISYEQAQAYCRWRSRQVTRAFWQGRPGRTSPSQDTLSADYARVTYRLPTESEWEYAAGGTSGPAHGTACLTQKATVNPGAAAYLKTRSGSTAPEEQIRQDILAFNRQQPLLSTLQYRDEAAPYFLATTTPVYVYSYAASPTGLFHMLGNVAELVQEPGLTKGGSYRDALDACTVKARGTYAGPAPTVGFRCVCEVSYPNRK